MNNSICVIKRLDSNLELPHQHQWASNPSLECFIKWFMDNFHIYDCLSSQFVLSNDHVVAYVNIIYVIPYKFYFTFHNILFSVRYWKKILRLRNMYAYSWLKKTQLSKYAFKHLCSSFVHHCRDISSCSGCLLCYPGLLFNKMRIIF